ncbi:3'-5'-bisphosphate nucleotidase [Pseudoalteromonas luteoviolacea CPMOR-1]|uniref:3'(2'),5'-bisphosphate nucleotidase CysQ n=2 Tax=Pseudoalteromonas luteoviolacea TaxID=43657 RepID=A0A167L2Z1_9GAMM|nr:3'(2'),5'-bisphosphate nucleotidase CysQ [Pseudoalteromonas luteoviolacea]KID55396.1 3'-5'-bisphosphate nucleotidase [Pseudoalteromonas luteoviolacea]KZN63723.1 3'-5'-bisphosphate nucleotidase [Pseudoalteromonas luteoviolacea CPMOR-1]
MQTYLEPCIELAQLAGKAIMAIYQQDDIGQQEKSDHTPVTAADLAANEVLLNGLKALAPDIPVMSEETPIPPLELRQDWQRYWLLDPMDGTGEFILQSGDFAVNIALIEGNQPVLGVIHWPAKNVTYFATKGAGAYKRSGATDEQICVAPPDTLTLAVSRRQKIEAVSQYLNSQFDTIALGSCSLKACIIAEGKADCFLRVGPTGEWDTGASQVIVEEAGGCITDAQFNPLTYNQRETTENPDFIVMGHPDWQFQKLISPHQR